jgi:hypothetical protein
MRRRVVVAAILALGWSAAAAIYATAPSAEEDPWIAEMESSREYERQVEVLGGKGALLANDLTRWFAGLWHGQSLAYTIAFLAIVAALAFYAWDLVRSAASGEDP